MWPHVLCVQFAIKKQPLFSCLPSQDLVPVVDQVTHPIQTMELALHSIDPFENLDMCPITNDLLPLDEVFLESLIQLLRPGNSQATIVRDSPQSTFPTSP